LSLRPLISAAMIVRNEERFLEDCLVSLQGFADEVVIVDTGSSDRTREIATAHGARLYDMAWRDDFSLARNFALDQASGDWILYIDADERVTADDVHALRADLEDRSIIAATVRFKPFTGNTAYPEFRLVRNRPDIRFEGAMHETYIPSINRILASGEGRVVSAAVTMQHIGYDDDQSHKLERNRTLLIKQIERSPDRLYLRWHLGCVYRDLGQTAEAVEQWTVGVEKARAAQVRISEEAFCFVELARHAISTGQDPRPIIDEGLLFQPDHLLLQALNASELLSADAPEAALMIYESHAAIDAETFISPISYETRLFGSNAQAGIGACLFKMGRYDEAARAFDLAYRLEPTATELRMKAVVARSRAGAAPEVL